MQGPILYGVEIKRVEVDGTYFLSLSNGAEIVLDECLQDSLADFQTVKISVHLYICESLA